MKTAIHKKSGFSLVELILSLAILAILTSSIIVVLAYVNKVTSVKGKKLDAVSYAQEGIEAVLSLKEEDFSSLDPGPTAKYYHLQIASDLWSLVEYPDDNVPVENGMQRIVTVERVLFEGDPPVARILKVKIEVRWTQLGGSSESIVIEKLISNWSRSINAVNIQTDWCQTTFDSISEIDVIGDATARDIAIDSTNVLISTGLDLDAGSKTFARFVHENNTPSAPSYISGYISSKLSVLNQRAYVVSDSNKEEVVIYDINETPFQKIGYFNAAGCDCKSPIDIFVKSGAGLTTGYLLMDDTIITFNASAPVPDASVPTLDQFTFEHPATTFYIRGNYAFIGFKDNPDNLHLKVLDVSDPYNIQEVSGGELTSLSGTIEEIRDVYLNSDTSRTYILTDNRAEVGEAEFIVLDSSTKGAMSVIDSYDTTADTDFEPAAFSIVANDIGVIVGEVSDPLTMPVLHVVEGIVTDDPVVCNTMLADNFDTIYDVDNRTGTYEGNTVTYLYLVTNDSDELKILKGQYDGVGPNDDPNQKPISRL